MISTFYGYGRPKNEVLEHCYQSHLSDMAVRKSKLDSDKIKKWAQEHCESFIWMDEDEVMDVSTQFDYIYTFYFTKAEDQTLFELKFK